MHDYNLLGWGIKRTEGIGLGEKIPEPTEREMKEGGRKRARLYACDGLKGPSVSEFSRFMVDDGDILFYKKNSVKDIDAMMRYGGRFGTLFHDIVAADFSGEPWPKPDEYEQPMFPKLRRCFDAWKEFEKAKEITTHLCEQYVFSNKHLYGGTFDRLVSYKGKRYILDFKTGAWKTKHYATNEAYCRAYREMTGETVGNAIVTIDREPLKHGGDPIVRMNFAQNHGFLMTEFMTNGLFRWKRNAYKILKERKCDISWIFMNKLVEFVEEYWKTGETSGCWGPENELEGI